MALQFVAGAAGAACYPASTGLVASTVSSDRLNQANGLLGMSRSFGGIVGPGLGGSLVVSIGAGWAVATDGAATSSRARRSSAVSATSPSSESRDSRLQRYCCGCLE
jgi:MFS family permease